MLNRLVVVTLLVALISCNLSRFFVCAGFSLNQNYIAATLCENKGRPWLHCNGRCYLMKKLRQAEQKEKSAEREMQKNLFQEALFTADAGLKFQSSLLGVVSTPYHCTDPYGSPGAVFQPPKA